MAEVVREYSDWLILDNQGQHAYMCRNLAVLCPALPEVQELTAIRNVGNTEIDYGKDFASALGTGGVVGTQFVWPNPGPHFKTVLLTREKEALWKKWTQLYNSKMLSRGNFLGLYTVGYDIPEGYTIAKDGKMYYAFFAPEPAKTL